MSIAELSLDAINYDRENDLTWSKLMEQYCSRLEQHGCKEFMAGFKKLTVDATKVEFISVLSARVQLICGWQLQPVDRLLPDLQFFDLLSNKIFPVAAQIRRPDEVGFSELPDIFHDTMGHLPLLMHPDYGEFLVQYSAIASKYIHHPQALTILARVYWYAIEMGLVMENGEAKALGAAILTSAAECKNAMSLTTRKRPFDLDVVFNTDYDPFRLQPHYFVIDSMQSLIGIVANLESALQRYMKGVGSARQVMRPAMTSSDLEQ